MIYYKGLYLKWQGDCILNTQSQEGRSKQFNKLRECHRDRCLKAKNHHDR